MEVPEPSTVTFMGAADICKFNCICLGEDGGVGLLASASQLKKASGPNGGPFEAQPRPELSVRGHYGCRFVLAPFVRLTLLKREPFDAQDEQDSRTPKRRPF